LHIQCQIEGTMIVTLAQQQPGGGSLLTLWPLLALVVLFYFMLIRPQQKRARNQRQLVDSLQVGDMVVTIGGFHGTVREVDESTVRLELNPSNVVTLSKQAIARRVVAAETGVDEEEEETDSQDVTEE
jgi:preprotein translocase subunit YajC